MNAKKSITTALAEATNAGASSVMSHLTGFLMMPYFCLLALAVPVDAQASPQALTREYLVHHEWNGISFFQNGVYIAVLPSADATALSQAGVYEIADGELNLHEPFADVAYDEEKHRLDDEQFKHIDVAKRPKTGFIYKNGALVHEANALAYTAYIEFERGDGPMVALNFGQADCRVKDGDRLVVDSVRAIRMGSYGKERFGTVTANAALRKTNSVTAEKVTYYQLEGIEGLQEMYQQMTAEAILLAIKQKSVSANALSYLPMGNGVVILARTAEKARVVADEDYWYYVEPSEGYRVNQRGWIFGKFLKLE